MKANIAFLYSNNISLSKNIARQVSEQMQIKLYIVEDRASLMLNEEGVLKEFIKRKFGENSYINGVFDPFVVYGLDFANSPELDRLQHLMNVKILDELNDIENFVLVVSNQLIETGILHLSDNLIVCKFIAGEEYDEYICTESIRDIAKYYIEPNDIQAMTLTLRGCLVECFKSI